MASHSLILRETLQRLGVPGVLGIAVFAASIVFGLAGVLPARDDLADARQAAARSGAVPGGASTAEQAPLSPPAPRTPAEQLDRFYAALPEQDAATDALKSIYQAAAKTGITLQRGEYRLANEPGSTLARYQVVMPVRGDYGQIRGFLREALARVPHMGLEEVNFERQSIMQSHIDARIRFTVYLRRSAA